MGIMSIKNYLCSMSKLWRKSVWIGLFLMVSGTQLLAQCAMCRGSVESTVSAGDTSMAANLNLGILYLFFTPYVLVAAIAIIWYKTSRKNVRKAKGAGSIAG
ncbi:hypothetical protein GCM10011340_24400 [Roseivirga thermotolerans]|jgi:hypothetical protein|uniref:Uncharacterized protein n=2 Tax=Roseivirgaceae TaxID=2762306 RepID=A0ABQ3I679_9BACT|nr:hypothetical protein GCM10011340_24400 [Roseivirga thermotolerans]|tara:strand:+ start:16866 stop:17171 length:306 start_codon:yes stop_codon:yes gene_type:complete